MKREHERKEQEQGWQLLVDAPLSSDLNDVSGHNNHFTLSSGSVSYVTVGQDNWINIGAAIVNLNSPSQLTYINRFKLEIDFFKTGSSPKYFQIVEGWNKSGVKYGIKIGTNWGTYLAIGINMTGHSEHDEYTYGTYVPFTNIPLNTPMRIIIENLNNVITSSLYNITNEHSPILIKTGTSSLLTINSDNIAGDFLRLGTSVYAPGSRYFPGYLKRFKLYTK